MKIEARRTLLAMLIMFSWLTVIVIGNHSVLAQDPTPVPGAMQHTVQLNDTVSKLALRFDTTVQRIVELNNLANPNHINVGQVLLIPTGSSDFGIAGITPTATSPSPTSTPEAPGTPSTPGSVSIPEPTSIVLMGLGLAGLSGFIRRQRKAQ